MARTEKERQSSVIYRWRRKPPKTVYDGYIIRSWHKKYTGDVIHDQYCQTWGEAVSAMMSPVGEAYREACFHVKKQAFTITGMKVISIEFAGEDIGLISKKLEQFTHLIFQNDDGKRTPQNIIHIPVSPTISSAQYAIIVARMIDYLDLTVIRPTTNSRARMTAFEPTLFIDWRGELLNADEWIEEYEKGGSYAA